MKVKSFNRSVCQDVSEDALIALNDMAAKMGLAVTRGSGSYSESSYTMKVVFSVVRDGKVLSPGVEAWNRWHDLYNLPKDALGKRILFMGRPYTIEGLSPRKSKYAILVKRNDGKEFRLTVSSVRAALGLKSF